MSTIETINRIESLKAWMHEKGPDHQFYKGVKSYYKRLKKLIKNN